MRHTCTAKMQTSVCSEQTKTCNYNRPSITPKWRGSVRKNASAWRLYALLLL